MPLYLEGLADNWEILLFVVGLILIGLEVFVIPGFGIAGIAGLVLSIAGLALSLIGNVGFDFTPVADSRIIEAFLVVFISGGISITGSLFLAVRLFESGLLSRLVLNTEQRKEEGYVGTSTKEFDLIGEIGVARTDLMPTGKVEIADTLYSASAESGYISKGATVKVVEYSTAQIKVRLVS